MEKVSSRQLTLFPDIELFEYKEPRVEDISKIMDLLKKIRDKPKLKFEDTDIGLLYRLLKEHSLPNIGELEYSLNLVISEIENGMNLDCEPQLNECRFVASYPLFSGYFDLDCEYSKEPKFPDGYYFKQTKEMREDAIFEFIMTYYD